MTERASSQLPLFFLSLFLFLFFCFSFNFSVWTWQVYCMVMRINIDCNGCYRKVRRALLGIEGELQVSSMEVWTELGVSVSWNLLALFGLMNVELETHLIEMKHSRVSVCGRFVPQDVAIKIRKKTNRRVEILEIQEYIISNENQEQKPLITTTSWNLISSQTQFETCTACIWHNLNIISFIDELFTLHSINPMLIYQLIPY